MSKSDRIISDLKDKVSLLEGDNRALELDRDNQAHTVKMLEKNVIKASQIIYSKDVVITAKEDVIRQYQNMGVTVSSLFNALNPSSMVKVEPLKVDLEQMHQRDMERTCGNCIHTRAKSKAQGFDCGNKESKFYEHEVKTNSMRCKYYNSESF